MLAARKINVIPINISTSANISPAPCADLSVNEVITPNTETTAIIEKSIPNIISKVEIVFFIVYKLRELVVYFRFRVVFILTH